jgi:AraC-like DNA-binding protein
MTWVKTYALSDPLSYQTAIQAANVEFWPTSKGQFYGELTQIRMNKLWMQRYYVNLPQIQHVANRAGRKVFGFPTGPDAPPFEHRGICVMPGEIAFSGIGAFHQRARANFRHGTMSLRDDDVYAAYKALIGREFAERELGTFIRPGPELMFRLLKLHRIVGQLAHDTPDLLDVPELARAIEQQMIHFMIRCFADGVSRDFTAGARRHDAILRRFEDFLAANPDRPLYLTEICAGIGVAERTLRAACEEHLGMGPVRYLTLRRLHLVRRALLATDASKSNVTRVVTDHGFWELGRFSGAYRTMFGESPSETLRRPPAEKSDSLNRPSSLVASNAAAGLH